MSYISSYKITEVKNIEVWSLKEVKNYLRITHDYDDNVITSLVSAAIESAEKFTGLHIHGRKVWCKLTQSISKIQLKYAPIVNLLKIEQIHDSKKTDVKDKFGYVDEANSIIHLADFLVGSDLAIEYETGFNKNIPRNILHGILMHTALMYDTPDNRGISSPIKDLYLAYRYLKI